MAAVFAAPTRSHVLLSECKLSIGATGMLLKIFSETINKTLENEIKKTIDENVGLLKAKITELVTSQAGAGGPNPEPEPELAGSADSGEDNGAPQLTVAERKKRLARSGLVLDSRSVAGEDGLERVRAAH